MGADEPLHVGGGRRVEVPGEDQDVVGRAHGSLGGEDGVAGPELLALLHEHRRGRCG